MPRQYRERSDSENNFDELKNQWGCQQQVLTPAEKEELKRLRKENRVLREERDILKKAAAFFAKESK